jgi:ribonuclease J
VVADFGPRNIERLDTFIDIASELGRKLVVSKKDAYLLDAVSRVDGADRMRDVHIFDRVRTDEAGAEERAAHDHQDGLLDPREIAAAPGDHLLCFSYPDMNDLLDVAPKGGVYIYSSSEAYTEESVFDFQRLWNWIRYFEMDAVGFSMGRDGPSFTKGYHASGHLSAEDLAKVLERIGAEKVIPVHTAHPERFRSIVPNVIVPEKGVGIEIR